jgi:hypothetical protein
MAPPHGYRQPSIWNLPGAYGRFSPSIQSLWFDLQMYKTGMITMLCNSLIKQDNVNRLTCHITMKFVSADSSCSVIWQGARGACAEVSTEFVEASKARLGLRRHMAPEVQTNLYVQGQLPELRISRCHPRVPYVFVAPALVRDGVPCLHVPHPTQPSAPAAAASIADDDDRVPTPCFTPRPALALYDSDGEVHVLRPMLSRLSSSTSLPHLYSLLAPKASGHG